MNRVQQDHLYEIEGAIIVLVCAVLGAAITRLAVRKLVNR